jgi:hypothetical protein
MGSAERRSWVEIPQTDVAGIIEEITNPKTKEEADVRRYAQLVHVVNSTSTAITSGSIDQLSGTVIEGYGPGTHLDAFSRLRISNPKTVFDSKQLHDKLPLFWDEELGGSATSVHVPSDAMTDMSVTASSSDFAIRQTYIRFNYQPGKSQLILLTAAQMASQTGVTKRLGAFTDDGSGNNLTPNNGIFFQSNGSDVFWNIAKNGSITENIARSSWNVDPLNGTGPSGLNVDFNNALIYFIDYSWLGVGSVRVGVIINEIMYLAHIFRTSNVGTSVYMSTPNLALRYDIQSDGAGAGSMDHICSTVISEGGQEATGITRSASRGASVFQTQNDTDIYPLITIRLKAGREDISVSPVNISAILTSNADYRWVLIVNPTVAGTDAASFVSVSNSSVEYDISRDNTNKLTGGEEIATGYIDKGQKAQISSAIEDAIFKLGSSITGVRDELVLAVQPVIGANENFFGSITWREFI